MKALRALVLVEFTTFLREPIAVFFTLVFPQIPLLVFGTVYGDLPVTRHFRVIDLYVPAVLAMLMGMVGLRGVPIAISEYKEQGVLKRFRATPLALEKFLAVHVFVQFIILLISSLLIVVVASLVFGIRFIFVSNAAWIGLAMVIGSAWLFTVGFAVAGVCSSARSAQMVGSGIFFSMFFVSGAAIPRAQFPEWLIGVTNYVPLTHVVDSLTGLWIGRSVSEHLISLGILSSLALIALVFTKLTFRWST